MKFWKSVTAGMLALCLLILTPFAAFFMSSATVYAEEDGEQETSQTETEIPESYYYTIESNEIEGWPQGPQIEAASAIVMDMDSGTILYSKQATEKQYPASITKIMTTLLLIENCDLDDTITFTEVVYDIEEGSTHLGIQPGEEMTLRDCAYGIMLASANDIANGVAEYIAGSVSAFANMMNEKAEELGCVNTHFSNPHGLYSDDHYTCAYDMALIAQAAYENETFREIVGATEYIIPETNLSGEDRSFLNHHKMTQADSEYYQSWCVGGKTGYTSQCLNTLVTYGSKDGMDLVCVLLRVNGAGKAYAESTEIMEYGFENFYAKNYDNISSKSSFYDIMHLDYLGTVSKLLSPVWERVPLENFSVHITLPKDALAEDVTYTVIETNGSTRSFAYEYNGQPVGTATGKLNTLFVPVQTRYSLGTDVAETESSVSEGNIQIEGLDEVLSQTTGLLKEGYQFLADYAEQHFMVILIGGAVLLVILVVLVVVLIFRATADARIRRRRRLEEEERKRREEEIERMTTAEIEAELREVMEQERLRKEQEALAAAEAEKAAREAEEMEWKAHETERLIDELERERQERISSEHR
ncbi:MAG: D-alanyl-D-alanine carboxypeptidase [Lachnospiraceae bacterium]|nr:D-alanyl-D-alanine carboxypeptidase [Lachnospiraceae bacterium]